MTYNVFGGTLNLAQSNSLVAIDVCLALVESWQRKESRLLSEHNDQVSQLSDQLHEKDLQIQQYETDLQVSVSSVLYCNRGQRFGHSLEYRLCHC